MLLVVFDVVICGIDVVIGGVDVVICGNDVVISMVFDVVILWY